MTIKRGYLDLDRRFDESHPTVSAIAPLICFASIFAVLVLLRIIVSFSAVAARCVETDQFWYTAAEGNWPLFASFALLLFLLLVWNVLIGVDDWNHSTGSRVMIIVNTLAILTTTYTLVGLHENAQFQYHARNGHYENIKFRPFSAALAWPVSTEGECATLRRFAGQWRVVDSDIGRHENDVPAPRIELTPWGIVLAVDPSSRKHLEGRWSPPRQSPRSPDDGWQVGYIYAGKVGARWDFELRGDLLILTSPDYYRESERSRITLQRDSGE